MKWIQLNTTSPKRPVYINIDQASSMQRNGNGTSTTIWFLAGHPDGQITVVETPEDIISLLNG